MHTIFRHHLIKKPWGFEYLAFESEKVALWVLHLKKGASTSMHAHPVKTTGLLLLSGSIELGFIADKKIITAPDKQMIRRGLFHQSKALTDDVILLEVETPNDKKDLVRLWDNHGRESLGYETSENYQQRDEHHLWFEENHPGGQVKIKGVSSKMELKRIFRLRDFEDIDDDALVMFLSGGLGKSIDGREHLATVPGDIAKFSILKVLIASMEFVQRETLILKVN